MAKTDMTEPTRRGLCGKSHGVGEPCTCPTPPTLAKRLRDEGFSKEWAARIEAIAESWLRERMPTREEIAVRIYDRQPHDNAWSFAAPFIRQRCFDTADAILALFTRTVGQ